MSASASSASASVAIVQPGPVRLRQTLVRLGPTFVKLGQYLALRPDVIPREYCDELLTLVDQVPAFPWPEARRVIREDLGAEPDEVFASFQRRPLAAGSLAQVYVARTRDGRDVAVKVQRPGIAERVQKDLGRLRWILRSLQASGALIGVSARDLHAELRRWMTEELDLERELRNVTRMAGVYSEQTAFRVPRPYPELSGGRVLSVELLEGLPLSELLRSIREGRPERVAELGYDRDALAENLLDAVLNQIFAYQLFHADTHPGNLIALAGDRIGFVDFGLIGHLDQTVKAGLTRYLAAVYSGDVEKIFQSVQEVLVPSESTDLPGFRDDFMTAARAWTRDRDAPREPSRHSALARFMVSIMQAAQRRGLAISPSTLSMYRSLLTAETVAQQLGTEPDLLSVGRRFFTYLQFREVVESLYPERLQSLALDLAALLRDGPGHLLRILASLADDRLPFVVRTAESREDHRLRSTQVRLLSASTLSVGVAVLLAQAGDTVLWGGIELRALLWVTLGALYLWILVLWRQLP